MKSFLKKLQWLSVLVGVLVGVLAILAIRYFSYSPDQVHYHANFAVFINGQRAEFKEPKFYEEVAVCSSTNEITRPEQRVHMHENVNTVAHVHDHASTWGQFFENLGWYIGPDFVVDDKGNKYIADDNNKLHVLINGQDYTDLESLTNMVIKNESKVLISFGNPTAEELEKQAKVIPSTAGHHNHTPDPGACKGSHKITPKERLKHLF